jgi:hypothetical protein
MFEEWCNTFLYQTGSGFYLHSERNGSADIFRGYPDGTGLEQLTNNPALDDQAAFSSGGKMISFVSSRNGQTDIYVRCFMQMNLFNGYWKGMFLRMRFMKKECWFMKMMSVRYPIQSN